MGLLLCWRENYNGTNYTQTMCIVTHCEKPSYKFLGSKTPSLGVNKHINSFVHSTSNRLPSSIFFFFYNPSLFLLASPFLPSLSSSLQFSLFLMVCFWKANHHNCSFHLCIVPKDQIKWNKTKHVYLQRLQTFSKIQFRSVSYTNLVSSLVMTLTSNYIIITIIIIIII
jgi:hypothetical protein